MIEIEDYPYTGEQLQQRLNNFLNMPMTCMSEQDAYRYILSSIDLTTLEGSDNKAAVAALCEKAVSFRNEKRNIRNTAAVCVYPPFVSQAKAALQGTGITVASVAGAFPAGQSPIEIKLAEIKYAIRQGADEIDMVINIGWLKDKKYDAILNEIRLEIGAMAAWTPTHRVKISPYAAEQYSQVFEMPETQILTTTAERSFWEKATILHQEAFRPAGSSVPMRYSRHYYDLYCMAKNPVKDSAIKMPELLTDVAVFKAKFYPRNWARYDLARIGSIKLTPPEHSIDSLRADYDAMQSMIYGNCPSFDEILKGIATLEKEINR